MSPDQTHTDYCPLGFRCESCGRACDGLAVAVVTALGAAFCLTLCPACTSSGRPPQVMLSTAARLVEQHERHVAGHVTHERITDQ